MSNETKGLGRKQILAVSMPNFLDSGCIVAGGSGLSLWAAQYHMGAFLVGLIGAISANALGAAIGALIGGRLTDKYGRRFVLTNDMLVYMVSALLVKLLNSGISVTRCLYKSNHTVRFSSSR